MKLDRETHEEGRGKYALVRLRGIGPEDEARANLKRLDELGLIDWGLKGEKDEFFVIKLRDDNAEAGLRAYADRAALSDPEWGAAVGELADRAAVSPFKKMPD